MPKEYKSIETQYIPAGTISSVEEFKDRITEEVHDMMKSRTDFQRQEASKLNVDMEEINVSLPIGIYILYKDMSAQRALLFPNNDNEKKAMILAMKKQIKIPLNVDGHTTCTEPIYGAFTAEVYMSAYKVTEEQKKLSKEELDELFQNHHMEEKKSRLLIQFEDAVTHEYDALLYSIIEPGILVLEKEESAISTEGMNTSMTDSDRGLMSSLFDYSIEQEIDILGSKGTMEVAHFDILKAIDFVKNALKD